jgi:hypothetical protein
VKLITGGLMSFIDTGVDIKYDECGIDIANTIQYNSNTIANETQRDI